MSFSLERNRGECRDTLKTRSICLQLFPAPSRDIDVIVDGQQTPMMGGDRYRDFLHFSKVSVASHSLTCQGLFVRPDHPNPPPIRLEETCLDDRNRSGRQQTSSWTSTITHAGKYCAVQTCAYPSEIPNARVHRNTPPVHGKYLPVSSKQYRA